MVLLFIVGYSLTFYMIWLSSNGVVEASKLQNVICPKRACEELSNPFELTRNDEVNGLKNSNNYETNPGDMFRDISGNPSIKKITEVHNNGFYTSLCWIEITTIKELSNGTKSAIREYAITFETPSDIPEKYISKKNENTNGDNIQYKIFDRDTKKSEVVNFTTISKSKDTVIRQNRKILCGSGPIYTKEFMEWPHSDRKRVEIRVSPKRQNLVASDCTNLDVNKETASTLSSTDGDFDSRADGLLTREGSKDRTIHTTPKNLATINPQDIDTAPASFYSNLEGIENINDTYPTMESLSKLTSTQDVETETSSSGNEIDKSKFGKLTTKDTETELGSKELDPNLDSLDKLTTKNIQTSMDSKEKKHPTFDSRDKITTTKDYETELGSKKKIYPTLEGPAKVTTKDFETELDSEENPTLPSRAKLIPKDYETELGSREKKRPALDRLSKLTTKDFDPTPTKLTTKDYETDLGSKENPTFASRLKLTTEDYETELGSKEKITTKDTEIELTSQEVDPTLGSDAKLTTKDYERKLGSKKKIRPNLHGHSKVTTKVYEAGLGSKEEIQPTSKDTEIELTSQEVGSGVKLTTKDYEKKLGSKKKIRPTLHGHSKVTTKVYEAELGSKEKIQPATKNTETESSEDIDSTLGNRAKLTTKDYETGMGSEEIHPTLENKIKVPTKASDPESSSIRSNNIEQSTPTGQYIENTETTIQRIASSPEDDNETVFFESPTKSKKNQKAQSLLKLPTSKTPKHPKHLQKSDFKISRITPNDKNPEFTTILGTTSVHMEEIKDLGRENTPSTDEITLQPNFTVHNTTTRGEAVTLTPGFETAPIENQTERFYLNSAKIIPGKENKNSTPTVENKDVTEIPNKVTEFTLEPTEVYRISDDITVKLGSTTSTDKKQTDPELKNKNIELSSESTSNPPFTSNNYEVTADTSTIVTAYDDKELNYEKKNHPPLRIPPRKPKKKFLLPVNNPDHQNIKIEEKETTNTPLTPTSDSKSEEKFYSALITTSQAPKNNFLGPVKYKHSQSPEHTENTSTTVIETGGSETTERSVTGDDNVEVTRNTLETIPSSSSTYASLITHVTKPLRSGGILSLGKEPKLEPSNQTKHVDHNNESKDLGQPKEIYLKSTTVETTGPTSTKGIGSSEEQYEEKINPYSSLSGENNPTLLPSSTKEYFPEGTTENSGEIHFTTIEVPHVFYSPGDDYYLTSEEGSSENTSDYDKDDYRKTMKTVTQVPNVEKVSDLTNYGENLKPALSQMKTSQKPTLDDLSTDTTRKGLHSINKFDKLPQKYVTIPEDVSDQTGRLPLNSSRNPTKEKHTKNPSSSMESFTTSNRNTDSPDKYYTKTSLKGIEDTESEESEDLTKKPKTFRSTTGSPLSENDSKRSTSTSKNLIRGMKTSTLDTTSSEFGAFFGPLGENGISVDSESLLDSGTTATSTKDFSETLKTTNIYKNTDIHSGGPYITDKPEYSSNTEEIEPKQTESSNYAKVTIPDEVTYSADPYSSETVVVANSSPNEFESTSEKGTDTSTTDYTKSYSKSEPGKDFYSSEIPNSSENSSVNPVSESFYGNLPMNRNGTDSPENQFNTSTTTTKYLHEVFNSESASPEFTDSEEWPHTKSSRSTGTTPTKGLFFPEVLNNHTNVPEDVSESMSTASENSVDLHRHRTIRSTELEQKASSPIFQNPNDVSTTEGFAESLSSDLSSPSPSDGSLDLLQSTTESTNLGSKIKSRPYSKYTTNSSTVVTFTSPGGLLINQSIHITPKNSPYLTIFDYQDPNKSNSASTENPISLETSSEIPDSNFRQELASKVPHDRLASKGFIFPKDNLQTFRTTPVEKEYGSFYKASHPSYITEILMPSSIQPQNFENQKFRGTYFPKRFPSTRTTLNYPQSTDLNISPFEHNKNSFIPKQFEKSKNLEDYTRTTNYEINSLPTSTEFHLNKLMCNRTKQKILIKVKILMEHILESNVSGTIRKQVVPIVGVEKNTEFEIKPKKPIPPVSQKKLNKDWNIFLDDIARNFFDFNRHEVKDYTELKSKNLNLSVPGYEYSGGILRPRDSIQRIHRIQNAIDRCRRKHKAALKGLQSVSPLVTESLPFRNKHGLDIDNLEQNIKLSTKAQELLTSDFYRFLLGSSRNPNNKFDFPTELKLPHNEGVVKTLNNWRQNTNVNQKHIADLTPIPISYRDGFKQVSVSDLLPVSSKTEKGQFLPYVIHSKSTKILPETFRSYLPLKNYEIVPRMLELEDHKPPVKNTTFSYINNDGNVKRAIIKSNNEKEENLKNIPIKNERNVDKDNFDSRFGKLLEDIEKQESQKGNSNPISEYFKSEFSTGSTLTNFRRILAGILNKLNAVLDKLSNR